MDFQLGQSVTFAGNGRPATVIGRAEYLYSATQYLVRYTNGLGDVSESWFDASAFNPA